MPALPEQVAREIPDAAVDEDLEDDLPLDLGQRASLREYLRGWLWIGLLVSPTLILGIVIYLVLR